MFNNTVYKCDLLTIRPDIKVYNDLSMRKNIMNAETDVVCTILVQKTFNVSYYKEILTGRLIPVYQVITHSTNTSSNGKVELDPPKSPCFIKRNMTIGEEGILLYDDLEKATIEELQDYSFSHINVERYKDYLFEVFGTGMKYYNDAKLKGEVTGENRIKRFLKAIKMANKI